MPFDFKKEQKRLYLPPKTPEIVTIPPMNFVAVDGRGDPNGGGRRVQAGTGGAVRSLLHA